MVRLIGCSVLIVVSANFAEADEVLFREQIAPIFREHCLDCHNAKSAKGGLSLETRAAALRGGESGRVIEPGDPASSYLLDLVTPSKGKAEMPRGVDVLSPGEVSAIEKWIGGGAKWPANLKLKPNRWWSLRPLTRPHVPKLPMEYRAAARNPIDAFILARHKQRGLKPSPRASPRVLFRRLHFDLVGLPPTPADWKRFEKRGFEREVNRLLASPRYGERWARHWLDVIHYGETHGYDKDKPRPNAWPYRDYVIRSFNRDKPWADFVEEQIAGDVLGKDPADGIAALGFLAAGPWDFIGHAEVPETKHDGRVARHLDRDDMVRTAMVSFTSLTVGCARCHDHKFDPITQTDYYRLQAVFAAVDRADREFDLNPDVARQRGSLQLSARSLAAELSEIERRIQMAGGKRLAELNARIAAGAKSARVPPQHGWHSRIEKRANIQKWVQVDLGKPMPIAEIELVACHDTFNNIGAGFGFPRRLKIEASRTADFAGKPISVADHTTMDFPNPGISPLRFQPKQKLTARFVRITATKLAERRSDYIFALSELKVRGADGRNLALRKRVTASDSIQAPIRWARRNLTDGLHPLAAKPSTELAKLKSERDTLLKKSLDAPTRAKRERLKSALTKTRAKLARLPKPQRVYAATIHHGRGAFRGTGHNGGKPREIRVLLRGNLRTPGKVVGPGTVACVSELPGTFKLPGNAKESARRAALAEWLTHRKNPLIWRSIANRVWQHHFGVGLVASSNDFGRMGNRPTHPALLDWLACELRDSGGSIKHLHRMILSSATWQQSSRDNASNRRIDASNKNLWRANRRRLDAEAIRDAMLACSGRLQSKFGGPSFRDFKVEKPQHSPHYQYHLHDPNDPRSHRRSIYRFLVRSKPQPLMTVLDCADPSRMVDRRDETVSPLQALAMLNNKLSLAMSVHFANRIASEDRRVAISQAFEIALARKPTTGELAALVLLAKQHGLANACRVLFNLNEFSFVD